VTRSRWASKALGVSIFTLTLASPGFAVATGAGQDQQQAPASGAISGVVVDALTGAPIEGATVSLQFLRPGARSSTDVAGVLTDARGRFVFVELEPSETYRARVSRIGYLAYSSPSAIPVDPSAWLSDVEFALKPAGQIDGRVAFENGDPAIGVRVHLWQQLWAAGQWRLMEAGRAEANDAGAFVPLDLLAEATTDVDDEAIARALDNKMRPLASLADAPFADAGDVRLLLDPALLAASSSVGRSLTYAPVCEPASADATSGGVVALAPGGTHHVKLRLSAVPGYTVAGVITGAGDSYSGLALRLYSADSGSARSSGSPDVATTVVAGNGRFVFVNIPRGRYTIEPADTLSRYYVAGSESGLDRTFPPGWERQSYSRHNDSGVSFETHDSRGDSRGWGRSVVDVDGDIDNVELTVARAGTLKGRITWPDGLELPRGYVAMYLEPASGDPALGLPTGRTRPDDVAAGVVEFEISNVRPGSYFLRPNPPPGWAVRSIRRQGEDWTDRPVTFLAGDEIDDVVVDLTDELPTLSGFVAEAAGPGARVTVVAFPLDRGLWQPQGRRAPRFVQAAAKLTGRYVMPGFPAGRYYIAAIDGELPPEWRSPEFLERLADVAEDRDIDWGDDLVLDLTARTVR
jgi:hypothetical protein